MMEFKRGLTPVALVIEVGGLRRLRFRLSLFLSFFSLGSALVTLRNPIRLAMLETDDRVQP